MFCKQKRKSRKMEKGNFKRGEIVWARVVYPHEWWPGFVIRSDFLGLLVSFFDCENSRYFLPSEICSFEENFRLLVEKCTNHILLNRALKFLGEDVISSLNCCGRVKRRPNASDLFQPRVVLGFVRSVAVSPWIERDDFLSAVHAVGQVMAFRHYDLVNSGVRSRVHTDQASVEKMHSVAAEVDNIKMGDDNLKFSENENSNLSAEHEDNNLSACLANGNNGSNLSPKESLSLQNKDQLEISSISQTRQQKIQALKEMMVKLGVLAIDPFYLDGECLNTLKSSFLSFRSLSCLYGSLRKKCSHIESYEAQLPNPAYVTAQQGTKVHRGKEKAPLSIVPCMESPVNCLGLKRQLDQSAFSEAPLKLRKTLSFSINGADAYLWRRSEGFNAAFTDTFVSGNASSVLLELFKTRPFSSIEAYAHLLRNIIGCEADLFDSFFSGTEVKLNAQNVSYIAAQSLTYMCSSSLKDLVLNLLNISHTLCNGIVEICSPLDNSGTRISYASMQQAQESEAIMKKHGTCIHYADDMTDKLLQPAAAQSVSKYAIGVPAKDDEASNMVAAGASKYQLNSHLIANELKPLPGNRDNSSSVKIREISMNVAVGCSFREKKDLLQPVTSDFAFKSKVGQQPEVRTSFAVSRSLLMKFPKDCSLPSKEELVKKFSPFGRVDSFKTKVYFYTGSARVVFLHQLDAVAAYQYAKRKKIAFGKENVKFWLDTSEDEKRSKELASFPSQTANLPGFNLKSCLRKSKPLEKEDKRCQRKVRFQIET